MKKIVLFLSGLVASAVLVVSLQGWHNAPPEVLAESFQKESSEAKIREEEQQQAQNAQQITDQLEAQKQAAEADKRAKQALAPFNN